MNRCHALSGPLAIAFALAAFPLSVSAEVARIALKELIDRSEVIVLATVTKVEDGPADVKPGRGRSPALKVATAQAIEVWKGTAPREIRYIASPTWTCDISDAEVGERLVLFLSKSRDSPLMAIAHSGRGLPLRAVKGKTHATLWEGDVRLPEGVTTIPGPEPEYSFIRSVELSELARLVKTRGR